MSKTKVGFTVTEEVKSRFEVEIDPQKWEEFYDEQFDLDDVNDATLMEYLDEYRTDYDTISIDIVSYSVDAITEVK